MPALFYLKNYLKSCTNICTVSNNWYIIVFIREINVPYQTSRNAIGKVRI